MKDKLLKNIVVDMLLFVAMFLVSVSGFLLKFVLHRGTGISTFLGLARRVWRDIHIWASIVLVVLLVVHLVQHWRTIDACVSKYLPNRAVRTVLYVVLIVMLAVMVLPWIAMFV